MLIGPWGWLVVGGLGGMAIFWPIVSSTCTNCWTVSEYDPAYHTPHFSDASLMHLQSSSAYSDTLHIRLHMLRNSTPPPASVPLHMLPLLVCLFVCLFPLPDCFC